MSCDFEMQFKESIEDLYFSPSDKERLRDELLGKAISFSGRSEEESEGKTMKKWTIKKIAAVMAIVLVASGGAAYASGIISTTSVGSSVFDYKYTYDNIGNAMSKAKIDASIPEEFSNGFQFDKAAVLTVEGSDENGSSIKTWPEIDVHYVNATGEKLSMSIEDASNVVENDKKHTSKREFNGINVNYDLDEYVFLPPEMEEKTLPSDMQERLDDDPHFFVSYGSEKEEHEFFSGASFTKDGVHYLIYGMDTTLSDDDLFEMCREVINMSEK